MKPRILIVGTVPYSTKATSRAFASYFTGWPRDKLAQIFSSTKTPPKGHCETLYQITDHRLLRARFIKKTSVGEIFCYDQLPDEWTDNSRELKSCFLCFLYNFGRKKSPTTMLLRRWLWSKKYWCTEELNQWLDDFKPECVFLSLSNDFFIQDIAIYVAERFDIPVIISIGDDYYFNYMKSLSPMYHWYKLSYRNALRKVFARSQRAIYISDKIKRKYVEAFGLDGETIYLSSGITRKPFRAIDKINPKISYFGNIKMGRNQSLVEIGQTLSKIDPNYILDVYSNETDRSFYRIFEECNSIRFHGSIPYSEVQKRTLESDIIIIVEGFKEKDIAWSRYSLSTKAADALSSGAQILVYGSPECGVIEYMAGTNSAAVCTEKEKLEECIRHLIEDEQLQKENYLHAIEITERNHSLSSSTHIFSQVVEEAIAQYANRKQF